MEEAIAEFEFINPLHHCFDNITANAAASKWKDPVQAALFLQFDRIEVEN